MTEQERYENMVDEIIDLKNEIKDLQAENERLKKGWKADVIETANIKAEAYKEFAKSLKEEKYYAEDLTGQYMEYVVAVETIDNQLKEKVGGQ